MADEYSESTSSQSSYTELKRKFQRDLDDSSDSSDAGDLNDILSANKIKKKWKLFKKSKEFKALSDIDNWRIQYSFVSTTLGVGLLYSEDVNTAYRKAKEVLVNYSTFPSEGKLQAWIEAAIEKLIDQCFKNECLPKCSKKLIEGTSGFANKAKKQIDGAVNKLLENKVLLYPMILYDKENLSKRVGRKYSHAKKEVKKIISGSLQKVMGKHVHTVVRGKYYKPKNALVEKETDKVFNALGKKSNEKLKSAVLDNIMSFVFSLIKRDVGKIKQCKAVKKKKNNFNLSISFLGTIIQFLSDTDVDSDKKISGKIKIKPVHSLLACFKGRTKQIKTTALINELDGCEFEALRDFVLKTVMVSGAKMGLARLIDNLKDNPQVIKLWLKGIVRLEISEQEPYFEKHPFLRKLCNFNKKRFDIQVDYCLNRFVEDCLTPLKGKSKVKITRGSLPDCHTFCSENATQLLANVRLSNTSQKRKMRQFRDDQDFGFLPYDVQRIWKFNCSVEPGMPSELQIGALESQGIGCDAKFNFSRGYQKTPDMVRNMGAYKEVIKRVNNLIGSIAWPHGTKKKSKNKQAALWIRQILNGDKFPALKCSDGTDVSFTTSQKRMLVSLTYLLFGCEVARNPEALISNQIMLDLVISGTSFADAIESMPMRLASKNKKKAKDGDEEDQEKIEGAIAQSRYMLETYQSYLPYPYVYQGNLAKDSDKLVKRQGDFIDQWLLENDDDLSADSIVEIDYLVEKVKERFDSDTDDEEDDVENKWYSFSG